MIVDAYTHIWESPQQLGRIFEHGLAPIHLTGRSPLLKKNSPNQPDIPSATGPQHFAACEKADKAIVLGFKSYYLEAHISNQFVADYVNEHPEKLIGFAGIDPTRPAEAIRDIEEAKNKLGMKGAAIAPTAQDFHPASSHAKKIYQVLSEWQMPLFIHQGITLLPQNKLEYARPYLLDEIAREFPQLTLIIAHLGYPWIDETIVMLNKHPNVYADISGLLNQPWRAFNALLTAYQHGAMPKLLFGSGFPFTSAASCMETLYNINQFSQGTNLPTIPREQLRSIVERPTLDILGINPSPTSCTAISSRNAPLFDPD